MPKGPFEFAFWLLMESSVRGRACPAEACKQLVETLRPHKEFLTKKDGKDPHSAWRVVQIVCVGVMSQSEQNIVQNLVSGGVCVCNVPFGVVFEISWFILSEAKDQAASAFESSVHRNAQSPQISVSGISGSG